jgi:SAM-dependent methyltransferase
MNDRTAADAPQKRVFLESEGDQWFARNRSALLGDSPERELLLDRVARHLARSRTSDVLEIGCGPGLNLAGLARRASVRARGVDPSQQAVASGMATDATLALRQGTADSLPYDDAAFDMVWFGFCLYLVDRSLLMRCVAEADRVLRDGGALVILDFDPARPTSRAYHHQAGMNSYKMDYASLFLANPAYALVEKHSMSHQGDGWHPDPQERVALTVCRKDLGNAYPKTLVK